MDTVSMRLRGTELLASFPVNGHFYIGIYQGNLSDWDILIKYRQKEGNKWSRIRTPKHIHWAVDIMIKQHQENQTTNQLIEFLINQWERIEPFQSDEERERFLRVDNLMQTVESEASNYEGLAGKGEYSVKFLLLLAKLLMVQEKTNRHDAYMFKKLLEQLKEHKNIFQIVSTATFH